MQSPRTSNVEPLITVEEIFSGRRYKCIHTKIGHYTREPLLMGKLSWTVTLEIVAHHVQTYTALERDMTLTGVALDHRRDTRMVDRPHLCFISW